MFEKQLTYDDLDLDDRELYFQMGYGDALPDDGVRRETEEMKRTVREILHPRFGFVVECNGEVDTERKTLSTGGELFNVGRIITSQIKNA